MVATGGWLSRFRIEALPSQIAHLREKLEEDAAQPKFITAEPAVGYRAMELEP